MASCNNKKNVVVVVVVVKIKIRLHCIVSLELMILLAQFPKGLDYRHISPYPIGKIIFKKLMAIHCLENSRDIKNNQKSNYDIGKLMEAI